MTEEELIGADQPDLQQLLSSSLEEPNGPIINYQCTFCSCNFLTNLDLQSHLHAFGRCEHQQKVSSMHKQIEKDEEPISKWFKSKYDSTEELMLAAEDPATTLKLQRLGTIVSSKFSFKLRGKWIVRKQIGA